MLAWITLREEQHVVQQHIRGVSRADLLITGLSLLSATGRQHNLTDLSIRRGIWNDHGELIARGKVLAAVIRPCLES